MKAGKFIKQEFITNKRKPPKLRCSVDSNNTYRKSASIMSFSLWGIFSSSL